MRLAFRRRGFQLGLGLGFGAGTQSLRQGMECGVAHGASPLLRHSGGFLVGSGGGNREGELVFQRQAQLLVLGQAPVLTERTAPVFILRVLALEHLKFNYADAGAQLHQTAAPMHQPPTAEGGKLRRGGWLLLAVVVGVVGVSIRGLRPPLPSQFPAGTEGASVPCSSVSFR